jgi:hypothetical protein
MRAPLNCKLPHTDRGKQSDLGSLGAGLLQDGEETWVARRR